MLVSFARRTPCIKKRINSIGLRRAQDMVSRFATFLEPAARIIDIGAGTGHVTQVLCEQGYDVTPLDVNNISFIESITPILYDGKTIPYADQSFDVALLLTVLHHTEHPESLLREAQRIAKRIVIIEDIYSNTAHKYLTYMLDSVLNVEFFGHPHSNKTDTEWQALFAQYGLRLLRREYNRSWIVFQHATYIVEP